MNIVRQMDCLDGLATLPPCVADLVYLDPPFFTGRSHSNTTRSGNKRYAFSDVWSESGSYAGFMHARVSEIHRVLKDTGSVFFHCDHNATHIARSILDDVFRSENFQSEIIWSYKRWSNSKKGLLQQHQTILFYSKTADFKWNEKRKGYSPTTNLDQILQQRARDVRGKSVYKRDAAGDVVFGSEKKGVPLGDVWEIPFLNPKAKERTGYPTQKPLELLDLIVELVTDAGDLVVDPFSGSGTTLVSAATLGRRYVGFDISADAVALAKSRIDDPVRSSSMLLQKGAAAYVKDDPWVDGHLLGFDYDRVHRNAGIDGILRSSLNGQTVCVRVQRQGETLLEAAAAAKSAARKKPGCMFALIQTEGGLFDLKADGLMVIPSPALQLARIGNSGEVENLKVAKAA